VLLDGQAEFGADHRLRPSFLTAQFRHGLIVQHRS
jgi:hypothetical protein